MIIFLNKLLFLLKNHTLFRQLMLHFSKKRRFLTGYDLDNFYGSYFFNYKFDCKNPRSFNEWLCYLKNNYYNEDWKQKADKLGSKEYLKEIGLGKYCVKTLGIYKNSNEIDLNKLPEKFVLKTNHDCGGVFICSKSNTNFSKVFKLLDERLASNYSKRNNEWVYSNIKPLIFAEEFLEPKYPDYGLNDYKIQTINGKYIFGYLRYFKNGCEKFHLFEGNYESQDSLYLSLDTKSPPPYVEEFEEMINIAEKIGKNFLEIRVDFYITSSGIKIGELTFFSQAGFGQFTNKKYDFKYGSYFSKLEMR